MATASSSSSSSSSSNHQQHQQQLQQQQLQQQHVTVAQHVQQSSPPPHQQHQNQSALDVLAATADSSIAFNVVGVLPINEDAPPITITDEDVANDIGFVVDAPTPTNALTPIIDEDVANVNDAGQDQQPGVGQSQSICHSIHEHPNNISLKGSSISEGLWGWPEGVL